MKRESFTVDEWKEIAAAADCRYEGSFVLENDERISYESAQGSAAECEKTRGCKPRAHMTLSHAMSERYTAVRASRKGKNDGRTNG